MKRNRVQRDIGEEFDSLKESLGFLRKEIESLKISLENKFLAEKSILVYCDKKLILLRDSALYRTKEEVAQEIMRTAVQNGFTNFIFYENIPPLRNWKVFLGGRELE